MTDSGHIEDEVAGRALRALSPDETAAVDGHIATCAPCRALLDEAEETADQLALVARPVRPPQRCKARLMERVARDAFLRQPTPPAQRSTSVPWRNWRTAGALALALMLSWNMWLQSQVAHKNMLLNTMSADPRPKILRPQGQNVATVAGRMFMNPDGTIAVIIVENLPPAPSGKVYQIWVADDHTQQPMETFQTVQQLQRVEMQARTSIKKYKWIMITLEDAPGSKLPSKNTVLFGDL
jgi:hypothetical protein